MRAKSIRRIGVLTSGGDCAGLNAAIRAVLHRAIQGYGWEVYGILDGTKGLMDRPPRFEYLTLRDFTGNILRMGGTILGAINKGYPFKYPIVEFRVFPTRTVDALSDWIACDRRSTIAV